MMKKYILASLAIAVGITLPQAGFADEATVNAPLATHMEYVTEETPIRVWVLPGSIDGVAFEGHYEFFSMPMVSGEPRPVMDGLPQEPAINAIPVNQGTEPAISR